MQAEEIDPRLVALGLVPPSVPAQTAAEEQSPAQEEAEVASPEAPRSTFGTRFSEPEIDEGDLPADPWLRKLHRAKAAADAELRASLQSAEVDERLRALSSTSLSGAKVKKVKPHKEKAEKVKPEKAKHEKERAKPERIKPASKPSPIEAEAPPSRLDPVRPGPILHEAPRPEPIARAPAPAPATWPAPLTPPPPSPGPATQQKLDADALRAAAIAAAPLAAESMRRAARAEPAVTTRPETAKPEKQKPKLERPKPEKVARPTPAPVEVFKPDPNATLLFAHTIRFGLRTIPLELWSDRVSIGKRNLGWGEVTAVSARGGRVVIRGSDKKSALSFVPAVDGVEEPMLAPLFAEIVLDASAGAPPRDKLSRALSDGRADTKYRFRERDDNLMPYLVLLITFLGAALLAVIVPALVAVPFRGGPAVGVDTFLMYPRLSPFEPRSLVAAIAGGMILSRLAMRAAAGRDLMLWARGTAAGWNRAQKLRARVAKVLAAHMLLHTREYGIAVLIAFVLFLPSARERVIVDADGVHVRAGFPLFDRDVPWSNVGEPTLIDHGGGSYDVILTTAGGGIGSMLVDTRGTVFVGLSPYALSQYAEQRHPQPQQQTAPQQTSTPTETPTPQPTPSEQPTSTPAQTQAPQQTAAPRQTPAPQQTPSGTPSY